MIWWNFFKYSFTNNEIVYFFYLNKKVWMYINQLMRKWAGEFSRLAVQRTVTVFFSGTREEKGHNTVKVNKPWYHELDVVMRKIFL